MMRPAHIALLGTAFLFSCGDGPASSVAPPAPHVIANCGNMASLQRLGLDLDAAREAHRRGAVRRYLRIREAMAPGFLLRESTGVVTEETLREGSLCMSDLYELGRVLFEHEYTLEDGLGREGTPRLFQRVQNGEDGGPETIACTSCHWKGGFGGAGAMIDNSQLFGDGDSIDTADQRNPPALFGAGVAQALAREMNAELARQRDDAIARTAKSGEAEEVPLSAKGIAFGVIKVSPDGTLETSELVGIDDDLVIKPFGWKGTHPTIRAFIDGALRLHMGIDDLEIDAGQVTALSAYVAALAMPIAAPPSPITPPPPIADELFDPIHPDFTDEWARGQNLFTEIGCANCHTPMLVLKEPFIDIEGAPGGGSIRLDLREFAEPPGLEYDSALGGYPVWLFSDMRRHHMGEENRARHREAGVSRFYYLTRRLWGAGDSAPYFYDGLAVTFDSAIERHGGEGLDARNRFQELGFEDKNALRVYLTSLRMQRRVVVP